MNSSAIYTAHLPVGESAPPRPYVVSTYTSLALYAQALFPKYAAKHLRSSNIKSIIRTLASLFSFNPELKVTFV